MKSSVNCFNHLPTLVHVHQITKGVLNFSCLFVPLGNYAYFVTSDNCYYRLDYNNDAFRYVSGWGGYWMSIRCIKR